MTVKEEKILLIARESEEQSHIITAIKQVVNNCIIDKIDINLLTIFDIEYLFLKIRMNSVSDIAKASYKDNEDNEVREFEIDLSKVEIKFPELYLHRLKHPVEVGDIKIRLKSPSIDDFIMMNANDDASELAVKMTASCIHMVDDVDFKTVKEEERIAFVEALPTKPFDEIKEFFENIPKLNYELKYTNKHGKQRTIVLDSLVDFFTP
jgi:hypothetical protein